MPRLARLLFPLGFVLAACGTSQQLSLPTGSLPSPTAGPEKQVVVTTATATPTAAPTATPAAPSPSPVPSPRAPWIAFGDSITQDAFHDTTVWTGLWDGAAPFVVNAGIRGADSAYALTQADEIFGNNPVSRYVGLAFGTNDVGHGRNAEAYRGSLRSLIQLAQQYGKQVMVARIPYSSAPEYAGIPALNAVVDEEVARAQLPAGPDLYAWFESHPDQIGPDGIHMSQAGDEAIETLWARAARDAGF